jgi:hypothetical protein
MPYPSSEKQFEAPAERYIHRRFVRDVLNPPRNSLQWFTINTTARAQPDRSWSAPDLLLVGVSSSALQPTPTLELIGFELKLKGNAGRAAVMQAKSQHMYLHRVYLTVCLDEVPRDNDPALKELTRSALDQGVGLIWTTDAGDPQSYRVITECRRHTPEWDRLERLLRNSAGPSHLERIRTWLAHSYSTG